MPVVVGKRQKWRILAAPAVLIALIATVMLPLVAIVSISLRPGNFAVGSLIPRTISLEHWKLALGIPYQDVDGSLVHALGVALAQPEQSAGHRAERDLGVGDGEAPCGLACAGPRDRPLSSCFSSDSSRRSEWRRSCASPRPGTSWPSPPSA